MAEGFFAAESPAQKRLNIHARRDSLFILAMEFSHWKLNPRIVRTFIDKSGDTVRWLEERGLTIEKIPPLFPGQTDPVWHVPLGGGKAVVDLLLKACLEIGVTLQYETRAKQLRVKEKGAVAGVVATKKGAEIEIPAKGVIISTGGYGGNKRLLKKYCPLYTNDMTRQGLPNMGDGLKMATDVGAATEGLGMLHFVGPNTAKAPFNLLNSVVGQPQTIWVNRKGERFTNEGYSFHIFEIVNALLKQPDKVTYTFFDEGIKNHIIKNMQIEGIGIGRGRIQDLDKEMARHIDKGLAIKTSSLDNVATFVGARPEDLESTVDEYNAFCDQGHDDLFAKDQKHLIPIRTPPFYALKCYPAFIGSIGGIKIDHHMQVINSNDDPIPGVYAVGVDAGGWEDGTYNARLSGSTFGFALNSGRIAGENAAAYVAKSIITL